MFSIRIIVNRKYIKKIKIRLEGPKKGLKLNDCEAWNWYKKKKSDSDTTMYLRTYYVYEICKYCRCNVDADGANKLNGTRRWYLFWLSKRDMCRAINARRIYSPEKYGTVLWGKFLNRVMSKVGCMIVDVTSRII